MKKEIIWFETAKGHLRTAKKNFEIGEDVNAFREAIACAEVAIKSIMIKKGIFTEKKDEHHRTIVLIKKIKSAQCLSPNIIAQLDNLIGNESRGGLGYIDISSPSGNHMDTIAAKYPNLRYPVGNTIPDHMVTKANVSEKIKQAEQLINILSPLF